MVKKLVIAAVVLLALAGGALFYLNQDDPPEELSVTNGSSSPSDTTAAGPNQEPASLDGTWEVVEGGDTVAGLRIQESFASGLSDHTAVGRSPAVTGSIEIAGTEVSSGSFTVDLTQLEFTDDAPIPVGNRANAMKSKGLETSEFPEATFELTAPIAFGEEPEVGKVVTAEATGDLTLHGVTKEVTFDVEATREAGSIIVATAEPVEVVLADYDIDKPTGGPIASIDDAGTFEFRIVLQPA